MSETSTAGDIDGAERDPVPGSAAPTPRRRGRRFDKGLLAVSVVITLGLVLVVRGLSVGITGDERANYPDAVERVDPVPEAVQALSQTEIFVDLIDGYTGVLVIDGVELETLDVRCLLPPPCPLGETGGGGAEPGQQITIPPATIYEAGNATLRFTPTDDAPITGFDSGQHQARLIYWPLDKGRDAARTYIWVFNVV